MLASGFGSQEGVPNGSILASVKAQEARNSRVLPIKDAVRRRLLLAWTLAQVFLQTGHSRHFASKKAAGSVYRA